jgi:sulfate adenylyltransferase subunit 1 (EFTu-like GTPase family)
MYYNTHMQNTHHTAGDAESIFTPDGDATVELDGSSTAVLSEDELAEKTGKFDKVAEITDATVAAGVLRAVFQEPHPEPEEIRKALELTANVIPVDMPEGVAKAPPQALDRKKFTLDA